jgi:membrane protease YdiL (CAAX protease family)
MKIFVTILNILCFILAILASFLLGLLGIMFLNSHVDSDQTVGLIMLLIVIPLQLCTPILGLWLAIKKKRFKLGLILGLLSLAYYIVALIILPGAIEVVARP